MLLSAFGSEEPRATLGGCGLPLASGAPQGCVAYPPSSTLGAPLLLQGGAPARVGPWWTSSVGHPGGAVRPLRPTEARGRRPATER